LVVGDKAWVGSNPDDARDSMLRVGGIYPTKEAASKAVAELPGCK
jgi:hypothetical protein